MERQSKLIDGRGKELKQPQAPLVYCNRHNLPLDNKLVEEETDREAKQPEASC